jgi:hypothetical protein
MQSPIPNLLLSLSAGVLLLVNWSIGSGERRLVEPGPSRPAVREQQIPLEVPDAASADSQVPLKPSSQPAFDWAKMESSDYRQYVKHLKSAGFPEELVRDIVVADINQAYEEREQALKPKPVPFDAPFAQRQPSQVKPEDWEHARQLWELRIEKQRALQEILGVYVPREILRTPRSLNYESYEYAIAQLPMEKRNAVQLAQEKYVLAEGMQVTSMKDRAAELEAYKALRAERDGTLRQALTPEEFDQFNMNTTPAGTELARRTIGMEPTEEEFVAMFQVVYKNWLDTGGVYGRWRAVAVPAEQIAASDREMKEGLQKVLGDSRYTDYQMVSSEMGQRMRNFAARFELSRETMSRAFELQTDMDQAAKAGVHFSADGKTFTQAPIRTETNSAEEGLRALLGPELWAAWQAGRSLKVNLDP